VQTTPFPLTEREVQLLRLIARGNASKEVAAQLDVSVKTVESHKAMGLVLNLVSREGVLPNLFLLRRFTHGRDSEIQRRGAGSGDGDAGPHGR